MTTPYTGPQPPPAWAILRFQWWRCTEHGVFVGAAVGQDVTDPGRGITCSLITP
jgi:hypothetical protein